MFEIIVWLNKQIILSVFLKINATSYKNLNYISVRYSNFLQIYTILNMPALNYKTQSTYLIRISQHFRLLSCPALASEGYHFMWELCAGDLIIHFLSQIHYSPILGNDSVRLQLLIDLLTN